MSDYLTPQEQSTAIELMYLRKFFPAEYAGLLAKSKGLGGIEEAFYISSRLNGADLGRFKLKKAFKKLVKVLKKANPVYQIYKKVVPEKIKVKMRTFEKKHRAEIKKLAAGVAILGGGFMFGPSILGSGKALLLKSAGAVSKVASVAKLAIGKVAGEMGIPQNNALLQQIQNSLPVDAQQIAARAGEEIKDAVDRVGKEKIQAIVNRYTNNGKNPFTGPDDPRLAAATTEVQQNDPNAVSTGNPDNVGINAAVTGSMLDDAQALRTGVPAGGPSPWMMAIPAAMLLL